MTRCPACYLHACLCPEIPRVATRTRVLILRHRMERHKPSNSGRLAALALPSCAIVEYGLGDPPDLDLAGAWLLYPEGPPALTPPPRCDRLVVLDGSWPQARRMLQRIPALRGLPRLSLPPPASPPRRLRRQPLPQGMSTIEAIARALELLEGPAAARPLDAIYGRLVARCAPPPS